MSAFTAHDFRNFLKTQEYIGKENPRALPAWPGFLPLAVLPVLALASARALPSWALMWALAFTVFAGCKWLTWWTALPVQAPLWRSFAYLLLWPGLDARAFLGPRRRPARAPAGEWLFALAKILLGVTLLWGAARFLSLPLARGWVGMLGLVFVLHFGLFHLLALAWRRLGVAVRPLMHWPVVAASLGDFWGERWNRGFSDIARRHIFKPLRPRFGLAGATLATFLVSGLVHDLVITIPARGGHGLPTLYFLLQGLGLLVERSPAGKRLGLRRGARGWLFAMAMTAAPVGFLFPAPFVERVMLPFFQFLGAV